MIKFKARPPVKNIAAFFLVAVASVSFYLPVQAAVGRFIDGEAHFASVSINALDELEVFNAFIDSDDIYFNPDTPITRAEFLSALIHMKDFDQEKEYAAPLFTDFSQMPEPFRPYVAYGYELGITTGKEQDGVLFFGWQDTITRQEAAVFICRYMDFAPQEQSAFSDDELIAGWAKGSVAVLRQLGVITGYGNGNFGPYNQITRGEAAVMLNRVYSLPSVALARAKADIFAGTGLLGYGNGSRLQTSFITPQGLFIDETGILYVTDSGTHLVSSIQGNDTQIIAGSVTETNEYGIPMGGFKDSLDRFDISMHNPGQAVSDAGGFIYITDRENHVVRKINVITGQSIIAAGSPKAGYQNGPSAEALFNSPFGIAIDPDGNKYIADTLNHCIRVIDNSGQVRLLAGTPETSGYLDGVGENAMFCEPTAIFYFGNALYVADSGNNMIRKIDPPNNRVTTVAGAPTAIVEGRMEGGYQDDTVERALFHSPKGLCVGPDGNIYVADTENHVIRKIDVKAGTVTTIAGTGEAGNGASGVPQFNKPMGLAIKDGKLYIADSLNSLIKTIDIP